MGLTAKVHGQLNVPVDFCWGERGIFSEWHPLSGDGSTKADLDNDDAIAPTILSVTRLSPGAEQTNASSVSFKVTFSELVTNVDVGDFYLTGTSATADGSTAHVASVVAASDAEATEDDEWIVTIDGINSAGTLFLEVVGID